MVSEFKITLLAPLTLTRLHPLGNVNLISTVKPLMLKLPVERVETLDEEE